MVLFKAKDYLDELDLIIRNKFEKLETEKKLAIVQVGENKASKKYIELKVKTAQNYGIDVEVITFKAGAKKSAVLEKIESLGEDFAYGGIVVQYPLPSKFLYSEYAPLINPAKDIDFFNPTTYGKYAFGFQEDFIPPVVRAFDFLCKTFKLEFKGKNYLLVGQGRLVGKPLIDYLLLNEATITSINEFSEDKEQLLAQADMVICASGQPKSITGDMLKRGACVVDFSYGDKENPGVGDYDFESNSNHLNVVSAVPGGMGPLVTRFLFLSFLEFIDDDYAKILKA